MVTERKATACTYRITRDGGAAVRAGVDSPVCAPLTANVSRLRRLGFVDSKCAGHLVIELRDELACARGAHLLSLHACRTLGRVSQWRADVARGTEERLRGRMRSLARGVSHLAFRFAKELLLAALQAFPAPRAPRLACVSLRDLRQGPAPPLDDGLHLPPAHQQHLRAVSGGKQGIHAQVHT